MKPFLRNGAKIKLIPSPSWNWEGWDGVLEVSAVRNPLKLSGDDIIQENDVPFFFFIPGRAYKAVGFSDTPGIINNATFTVDKFTLSDKIKVSSFYPLLITTTGKFFCNYTVPSTKITMGGPIPDPVALKTGIWKVVSPNQNKAFRNKSFSGSNFQIAAQVTEKSLTRPDIILDTQQLKKMEVAATAVPLTPPGDCSVEQWRILQNDVHIKCDTGKRSCKGVRDCPTLVLHIKKNDDCINARQLIMNICFRGGDERHKNVLKDVTKDKVYCLKQYEELCKPKTQPEPLPQPVTIPVNDLEFLEQMKKKIGLTGAALIIYLIISEGTRLFPARNLIPIP